MSLRRIPRTTIASVYFGLAHFAAGATARLYRLTSANAITAMPGLKCFNSTLPGTLPAAERHPTCATEIAGAVASSRCLSVSLNLIASATIVSVGLA